jgi:hypothetical protein
MVTQIFLVQRSVSEINEPVVDDGVTRLTRNAAIDELEVAVLGVILIVFVTENSSQADERPRVSSLSL